MAFRQKKLTLNTPYNRITRVLWQNKKNNTEKQKQNLQLKTKIQKVNNKQLSHENSIMYNKLRQKFEKLSNKFKQQGKWIKQINHTIQERNYEQLIEEVHKIQSNLIKLTEKVLIQEKKYKKINKKVQKIQQNIKFPKGEVTHQNQYLFQLQLRRQELIENLESKSQKLKDIQNQNKYLNKQIIQLLNIKNQLKSLHVNENKEQIFHKAIKYKEIMIDQIEI